MVNIPVPHVVDGAAGAAHDQGAQAEDGEEGGVRQAASRRGQSQAPPTRPKQQPGTFKSTRVFVLACLAHRYIPTLPVPNVLYLPTCVLASFGP